MAKIWRKDSAESQWLQANYKGRWPKDLAAEMTQRFGYIIPPSRVSYYLYHLGLKTGVGAEAAAQNEEPPGTVHRRSPRDGLILWPVHGLEIQQRRI